jgi:hypothetical protein
MADARKPTVAVFGAGIAGLTAAHELMKRGHAVNVYEVNPEAGGFFRSTRANPDRDMPSEYSWHGMGPWYHNVYDLLQDIPFDETGSIYEKGLSRPIDFGMAPDAGRAVFDDNAILDVKRLFRMTRIDTLRWMWWMLKTWTAGRRSSEHYSQILAAEAFRPILSPLGWKTWCASFGPWVGSDWTNVSLHQVGLFFRKHLIAGPHHRHPADEEGPAWEQKSRTGWLLLRGPSSEVWFDRWVAWLGTRGVKFHWSSELRRFDYAKGRILRAHLTSGEVVRADAYVLAVHPFAAADIVERSPGLVRRAPFDQLRPLVQDGPHTQVSFRIAFAEPIAWPRERTAIVIPDSEFNLTLFAEEQVWRRDIPLGEDVAALWTCTACVARRPGRLFGLPLERCTEEQFVEEVKAQLASCGALDALVREANGGRSWKTFPIVRIEVWHEWKFSPDGIQPRQPKWVNTTNTEPWLPPQRTDVANLVLAGAHTRTDADLWSIEAAVESGRRAARVLQPSVPVIREFVPRWLRAARKLDDAAYALGLPHLLDIARVALPMIAGGALVALLAGRASRRK